MSIIIPTPHLKEDITLTSRQAAILLDGFLGHNEEVHSWPDDYKYNREETEVIETLLSEHVSLGPILKT